MSEWKIGQRVRLRQPRVHYRRSRTHGQVLGRIVERRLGPSPWRNSKAVMDLWLFEPDAGHDLPDLLLEECHLEFFSGAAAVEAAPGNEGER